VVLGELVLRNLREAITYVSGHEEDFIREAADLSLRDHNRELVGKKEALTKAEKRIAELDTIVKKLYEDNFNGKLTDERFVKLSRDYELEQSSLSATAEAMRQDVKRQEQKKNDVKSFIATVKKYTDLRELDATALREFVDRIVISAMDKTSKERKIHTVYNFIGAFDFEEATQDKTNQKQQKTA